MHRRPLDIRNLFIKVYNEYPASVMGREDIELSNSIILPSEALASLSLMKSLETQKIQLFFLF